MATDAYLSSSEETMFGNVLEKIAIAICEQAKTGRKSGIRNIDLEYEQGQAKTIIQVKSGVNWGNSSAHKSLESAFDAARIVLRQGNPALNVRCIEGICYGKDEIKDKGTHHRYVGHLFWKEISDWDDTAAGVMEILGKHTSNGLHDIRSDAEDRVKEFLLYSGAINLNDLSIEWDKLLELVMGKENPWL